MKKLIVILLSMLLLTGCVNNDHKAIVSDQNITPNLMSMSDEGLRFYYVVDRNTHVVYLAFDALYRAGITPLLKADGTPTLAEDLGIKVD